MKKKLVILSGAGISAESGIRTFRDGNGLWNEFKIDEVCTADAWNTNPTLVNDFYNMRRIDVLNAEPNLAHIALVKAEEDLDAAHSFPCRHVKAPATSGIRMVLEQLRKVNV